MADFDILVIGAGMIGAAAARYLSAGGARVGVVGPAEPTEWRTHTGVFASHYDQGRITRIIDPDPIWSRWARDAIAAYPEIAQRSGIDFHVVCGGLNLVHRPGDAVGKEARLHANGAAFGATYRTIDGDGLAHSFPFLHFPAGFAGVWETGAAGYINPRSLVAAQLKIAELQGAQIIRQTAISVSEEGKNLRVETDDGSALTAGKVLVATGGFANCHNLLLGRRLSYIPKLRTILLAELSGDEAERLAAMPTIICPVLDDPLLASIYVLPPVLYPDGKRYIKLGGNNEPERYGHSLDELRHWFQSDGDPGEGERLRVALHELIPDLAVRSYTTRPCVVTYTAHGYPYLDALLPGRLYLAVGGCGAAAKSSDAIGAEAARLVLAADGAVQGFSAVFQR